MTKDDMMDDVRRRAEGLDFEDSPVPQQSSVAAKAQRLERRTFENFESFAEAVANARAPTNARAPRERGRFLVPGEHDVMVLNINLEFSQSCGRIFVARLRIVQSTTMQLDSEVEYTSRLEGRSFDERNLDILQRATGVVHASCFERRLLNGKTIIAVTFSVQKQESP